MFRNAYSAGEPQVKIMATGWFVQFLGKAALVSILASTVTARAQDENSPASQFPETSLPTQEQGQENTRAHCVQPAPMVGWKDYQGPFNKVVGAFGRRLDRTSVHPPHYKPGDLLCSLTTKGKFVLFA